MRMPITVLNPTSKSEAEAQQLALPLTSLRGLLIGVLDNSKVNADRIFGHVEKILLEQYEVRELLWRRKHDFSRPAPPGMLAELSACNAIITGIGD
jgi:hypothetical protein